MGCYRCWTSQGGDMAPTCLSQASHLGMQALCVKDAVFLRPWALVEGDVTSLWSEDDKWLVCSLRSYERDP